MATKKTFKMEAVGEVLTAAQIQAKLAELENLSDPYNSGGRCPYSDGQKVGKFEGFRPMKWESDKSGHSIGLQFEGLDKPVSLGSFFKTSEDAVNERGEFYHIENPNEGITAICRKYSGYCQALWDELDKYLGEGEHEFQITSFVCATQYGKQRRHLINII